MRIETFTDEVHAVLRRLYEPQFLRRSPLVGWLSIDRVTDPVQTLRKKLTDAIQSLKPVPRARLDSNEYRTYQILLSRFLDQAGQKEVANDLGVSERQLRRLEVTAVRTLSEILWAECVTIPEQDERATGSADSAVVVQQAEHRLVQEENEIERLRATFPQERIDLLQLIRSTQKTIEPLSRQFNVSIEFHLPDSEIFVVGPLEVIRQVLLNLLAAGTQSAPGGTVSLDIQASTTAAVIEIRSEGGSTDLQTLTGEISEKAELTNQLAVQFGGSIEAQWSQVGSVRLVTRFAVPLATTVHVLVIEDNPDLIKLYERYVSGTPYKIISVEDPTKIIPLIEKHSPEIIMLDVMMPACDGWEVLGQLRENAATEHIPVIICSILLQESLAYALGAAGYVRKPVKRETFLMALDQQVETTLKRR